MTSQYRRGADFERTLKKFLEDLGYYVVRSAGSKGKVDLVAFNLAQTWFIQCKLTGKITAAETKALKSLAKKHGAIGFVATPDNYKEYFIGR